jgi:nitroreductase
MNSDKLKTFLGLVRSRRSVRDFRAEAVPAEVIAQLLDAARWAPSGYNLQPVHFVVVKGVDRKAELREAGMDQRQISEAPVVVVFVGDGGVVERHFEEVLAMDIEAGAVNGEYERLLRKYVSLAFSTGPVGLGWLWKAALGPVMRWLMPIPSMPAVHRRYWLAKQVGLSAMNFMLAAHAAGLASCPMEGFDSRRVGRVLGLPGGMEAMLVVPVGFAVKDDQKKTRLPLSSLVHEERWVDKGKKD